MIRIFESAKNLCRITFKNPQRFKEILSTIRGQPSSRYDDKHKEWVVPVDKLSYIVDDLHEIDDDLTIDKKLERKLKKINDSRNKLLRIKERLKNVTFKVKFQKGYNFYPFQAVGAGFLYLKKRCLLADVVGLGKTIQGLGAVQKRFEDGTLERCMIVCPASLKVKWQKDIKKFFGIDAKVIEGTPLKRMEMYNWFADNKHTYIMVTYDTVRNDIRYLAEIFKLFKINSTAIICDEVQALKNHTAKRSKAMKKIAYSKSVRCFYGLTATYIENGLENLFGIFSNIDKDLFGTNYYAFLNNYCETDYFGSITGYHNVPDAVEKLNTYTIRRQKEQVLEQLPKITNIDYYVELTSEQRSLYDDIQEKVLDAINDPNKKRNVARSTALTQTSLLMQACLSAELFDAGEHSTKVDELIQIVEGMDKKCKLVVFCHYTKMVEIICRELNKSGFPSIYMHGSSDTGKPSKRQDTIDAWAEDPDLKVLVTSDILAEGVDLVAANYLLNFDQLWNPAKMDQRKGRIDRISQKADNITFINIIAKGTIEEKIFDRLAERREIIKTVVDGGYENGRINMMSLDDIKDMFK